MELVNLTPFALQVTPSMSRDDRDLVLLVVMASYEIPRPHEATTPRVAEEQPPPPMTDAYHGDPSSSSLRVEGQSIYARPGTDVYIRGHAWTPGGRPSARSELHVRVGPCRHSALVLGERVWSRSFATLTATRPTSFECIPILWERSFGGSPGHARGRRAEIAARNPVGCGLYEDRPTADGRPLPNFEDPRQPISGFGDLPEPVGFGPIPRHWQPRLSHAGTYDQTWVETRAPLWPADMDERLFCAAAPGLHAQPHLRGGEPVILLGLHPDGPIEFELPALALTARFEFRRRILEQALVLDAIDIDGDHMRLGLIWRTAVQADPLELQSILVRELATWERVR
ncbi:hypothetical protein ENSA5_16270 [Enhygromyxa salina]|uniref:DUF2169 domain-containing protein n=2 Tax=Enhygromyxa salina TaxID=215803 RepID=A0A2S9YEI7_9BACT|nr:hypothetical protein ENSA5_16270 [Enhygromyxa salina]